MTPHLPRSFATPVLVIVLCSLAGGISASAQLSGNREKASLATVTNRTVHPAGSTALVAAKMMIEPGWHTNSHEPTFDYLIATELELTLPDGWPSPLIDYPEGEMKSFAFADQPISVYDGQLAIMAHVEIPADTPDGRWNVEAALTYQACDDRSCLAPVTTTSTSTLVVGSGGKASSDAVFSTAPTPRRQQGGNLLVILLLGMIGGLILNAMPCVLPVLSLKVFGLVKSAGQGRSHVVVGSLATSLGILLSFWALALAAVLAKSAGGAVGWGVQFQEPIFVTVLAIIVVLFCLNLWGVFEIPLPARLAQFADSGPKEGIPGHLASGLFATLMATPCSAPFLGTAVGFALSQSALTIFAVFTSIALGMALPYLALAAAPGAARLLPKPGPWMEKLRFLMGFLLAAAAIWLLYVLAAQMGRERLAFIELALLGLALFVWIRHQAVRSRPARVLALLGIIGSVVLAVMLAGGARETTATETSEQVSSLIPWTTFDRQEAEGLAADGRIVFVDVTADWCFTCKVNERVVLDTPEVAAAFERYSVVAMKADWTNRSDAITHFLADHGRYGIPFYLLYRPGQEPHVFSELLNQEELVEMVRDAAAQIP
jgi:suppressor for copper-sensitivity B